MEEKPSKKSFEELVDEEQKMYYSKARWLLDNNYMSEDIDVLARRLYDAAWRVKQL